MKLSRRHVLLGGGAALIASPFLSLLTGRAGAQQAPGPRRLVLFFTPNGTIHPHWRPLGSGREFELEAGSILEPLAPLRSDIIVVDGVDFYNEANHEGGMAAMLTGSGRADSPSGGMSVDQFIAAEIGGATRFSSLELGVQTSLWGGGTQTRMSYSAEGAFVPPDDDPVSVYQRLFRDLVGDPLEIEKIRRRRQSVLDLVRDEVRDLRGRVGGPEREKLDAHLEALRRVENGLSGNLDCSEPEAPSRVSPYDNDSFPEIGRMQMDLLVTALSCGMTRVASLQWTHTVAPTVFSWLGLSEGHHTLSHSDDANARGVADFVTAERWYTEQFVYLSERLKEIPEPDGTGTLFDTTLLVWCKELGDGRLHDCLSVPFVLTSGGRFEPGRYLDFGGAPHQKLLVSICQAMGLTNPTFGDPSYGTGPLEGLA